MAYSVVERIIYLREHPDALNHLLQPLDKLEREEVRKEALKFVEKGFQLVAKEKVGVFFSLAFYALFILMQADKILKLDISLSEHILTSMYFE